MYTMGARKYDEMTPYVNITILFVKFSELIREFSAIGAAGRPRGGVRGERRRLY